MIPITVPYYQDIDNQATFNIVCVSKKVCFVQEKISLKMANVTIWDYDMFLQNCEKSLKE